MSKWSRPISAPIPTIWATFEGRKVIDGSKRKYWIQDITDEYIDRVVQYMVEEFTADEPLCKYSKCYDIHNSKDVEKLFRVWKKGLECNLGLVCLTNDENGKPTIAGMNCTTICSKFDNKSSSDGNLGKVLETLIWVKDQVDPFAKFNITEYLDALGLYVPPKYRGEGLGYELLKARESLCRTCGIKASLSLFTSQISQKLAERAGFKDLYAIDYDELERRNPKFRYPNIQEHTKALRFMYILYE